eukprot:2267813-Rhodomonas_salina.1
MPSTPRRDHQGCRHRLGSGVCAHALPLAVVCVHTRFPSCTRASRATKTKRACTKTKKNLRAQQACNKEKQKQKEKRGEKRKKKEEKKGEKEKKKKKKGRGKLTGQQRQSGRAGAGGAQTWCRPASRGTHP